ENLRNSCNFGKSEDFGKLTVPTLPIWRIPAAAGFIIWNDRQVSDNISQQTEEAWPTLRERIAGWTMGHTLECLPMISVSTLALQRKRSEHRMRTIICNV